jgi:hypothetical protein
VRARAFDRLAVSGSGAASVVESIFAADAQKVTVPITKELPGRRKVIEYPLRNFWVRNIV